MVVPVEAVMVAMETVAPVEAAIPVEVVMAMESTIPMESAIPMHFTTVAKISAIETPCG